jgi:hypothetical protein
LVERFVVIEISVPNLLHNASWSLAREFSQEELTIRKFEKHCLRPAWCRFSNLHNWGIHSTLSVEITREPTYASGDCALQCAPG